MTISCRWSGVFLASMLLAACEREPHGVVAQVSTHESRPGGGFVQLSLTELGKAYTKEHSVRFRISVSRSASSGRPIECLPEDSSFPGVPNVAINPNAKLEYLFKGDRAVLRWEGAREVLVCPLVNPEAALEVILILDYTSNSPWSDPGEIAPVRVKLERAHAHEK